MAGCRGRESPLRSEITILGWRGRGPDRRRADELRCLRQRGAFKLSDREALLLDRPQRGPVAVAADDEAVQPVQPVLQPGDGLVPKVSGTIDGPGYAAGLDASLGATRCRRPC